jgi:RES domain-containing protein
LLEFVLAGRTAGEISSALNIPAQTVDQVLELVRSKLISTSESTLDEFVQSMLRLRIDDLDFTTGVGMKWLSSASSPVLKVPSAVMPAATNYLLNPEHPDAAEIEIVDTFEYPFDRRLK